MPNSSYGNPTKKYSIEDAKGLVRVARESIIYSNRSYEVGDDIKRHFGEKQGVFVTLKKNGGLRGCIGFVLPHYPLYESVVHCARAAAFEDPRFPPIDESEMKNISIEISILSVPAELKGDKQGIPDKIKIGRDGLIIRNRYSSGLLLPQVFVEYKSTPVEALEMTCEKAGLEKNAWTDHETIIEAFHAQVFKELNPRGALVEEKLS